MIRPASTVCALRPGPGGMEVLMVRRGAGSVFMGDAYVFPGGAVDDADHSEPAAAAVGGVAGDDLEWRAAALRELAEEANLFLVEPTGLRTTLASTLADVKGEALYEGVVAAGGRFAADALGYLSNWVTPPGPPRRFDTRFYVVAVGEGTVATADDMEVEDARWITPGQALALGRRREWTLYRPTIKHLELLNRFATPEETVAFARSQAQVPRVAPEKSKGPGGDVEVMMPRGHGFTTAPPSEWER